MCENGRGDRIGGARGCRSDVLIEAAVQGKCVEALDRRPARTPRQILGVGDADHPIDRACNLADRAALGVVREAAVIADGSADPLRTERDRQQDHDKIRRNPPDVHAGGYDTARSPVLLASPHSGVVAAARLGRDNLRGLGDCIDNAVRKFFGMAAIVALVLAFGLQIAVAQPTVGAPATPVPVPTLPPAGIIPSAISLSVTGSPADGAFLDMQIRNALDRQIRPTLRPGSSIRYGSVVPWPLLPLAAGSRAAVNVTVTLAGGNDSTTLSGVTRVDVTNEVISPAAPSVLFLSDDPEYLQSAGLVFRGKVDASRPGRLYYYHGNIGLPRDLDVVLTAATPSRLQVIQSTAGPDLDVMNVGHAVSRDLLLFERQDEGIVVDITPGVPFTLRHDLILQEEVVAGAIDLHPLTGGPVEVSVVASPAGAGSETYLNGPRLAFDGHNRHGTFDLDGYGVITTTYTAGGPDVAIKYGHTSPRNVDPADTGRDYGAYGVIHRITFTLVNPTDIPHLVYLYEKPLGGSVRSSFLVDGQLKEVGCARLAQPYWFMTYELAPHSVAASTTRTMTDGGSSYPVEFGTTEALPVPITPPLNASDGCSPKMAPPVASSPSQILAPGPTASGVSTSIRP